MGGVQAAEVIGSWGKSSAGDELPFTRLIVMAAPRRFPLLVVLGEGAAFLSPPRKEWRFGCSFQCVSGRVSVWLYSEAHTFQSFDL